FVKTAKLEGPGCSSQVGYAIGPQTEIPNEEADIRIFEEAGLHEIEQLPGPSIQKPDTLRSDESQVQEIAGRLSNFQNTWKFITSDPLILEWVNGYKIPFESLPHQDQKPPTRQWSQSEFIEIQKEINRLRSISAITTCIATNGQFISSYFLIPKSDGNYRFILNLKKLNKFVNTEHFKLEDLRAACRILTWDMFMGTINLREAYFLIPIHTEFRKFLRFEFNNQLYEFTCLPFGLSSCPLVFTKLMKPVMNWLRSRGLLSVIYLDDILCLGESYRKCQVNIRITCRLLEALGFMINKAKSNLNPGQKCKYLGFYLNSKDMSVELPAEKKARLLTQIHNLEREKSCSVRKFARLIGSLVASCPGVEYGMIHSKALERAKLEALDGDHTDFEKRMRIPAFIKEDLTWGKKNLVNSNKRIRLMEFRKEIFSDASMTGWGAFCEGNKAHGLWSYEESKLHINQLELKAALLALKCFARNLSECDVLLRIDNTTAMAYVNRMGGVKADHLHADAKKFWNWCERRKLWVLAEYIPSRENVEADTLSRIENLDIEWELSDYAFQGIIKSFGEPEIDLFASRINSKCKTYCAWKRDPDAKAINAFTLKWSDLDFYAFPPFSMIARVLQKIKNDKASGIVVVPLWTGQTWFPDTSPSASSKTYPGCRQAIREALKHRGASEDSIGIMLRAWEDSTLKQYNSTLALWWTFNNEGKMDPLEVSAAKVLEFLTKRYKEGANYGTLNAARSALATISAEDIGANGLIRKFIRGSSKSRPSNPRYDATWDVDPVLRKLEEWFPLEALPLKQLSYKLVLMMALGTAHRLQTLASIRISNILKSNGGIEIKIPERIKTSKPSRKQPLLRLPFFKERPGLCIARTLLHYLEATKKIRNNEDKVFISVKKPHNKVGVDTLGRWIRSSLTILGVDKSFTARSTRHASTSKAYKKGVRIEEIKQVAGWSRSSKVFTEFYNRPVTIQENSFATTVMLPSE
ncbi:PREDICTED: uncharacterized protein LOC105556025, partial [Vollenhovia emeryi]|uniref:uncharacterized protein LOC105556025 n=1 Tax=Vollenhovia emeryi TaxID=411798 RepID=UPI0005F42631